MQALVPFCINQYMKFEVRSFTNYRYDWDKILKNGSCQSDHAPFKGGLSPQARI